MFQLNVDVDVGNLLSLTYENIYHVKHNNKTNKNPVLKTLSKCLKKRLRKKIVLQKLKLSLR